MQYHRALIQESKVVIAVLIKSVQSRKICENLWDDNSHERVFNNNQVVDPEHKYTYDAIYRLIEANGREHVGLNVPDYYKNTESFKQSSFVNLENTNDSNKLANYTRQYSYDKAGNLHRIQHIASDSFRSFTREIAVDQYTNRAILKESDDPINFNNYFDVNGNCIQLEDIASLGWNYRDNISSAVVIQRETQPDDAEYYVYDAGGNRVRKVTERLINGNQLEVEEKIYLGGVEIKRIRQQNTQIFDRSSLHVMDDQKRLAIVHNWSVDTLNRETNSSADLNTNKTRYQFENHLGSASLELDSQGQIISYEEYFPYGGTSFMAGTNQSEVKLKEYRYSGKERDDTTGLYYYGARYYAPWLGRWMSTEPLLRNYQTETDGQGRKKPLRFINYKYATASYNGNPIEPKGDKANGYIFCSNNPINKVDLWGLNDNDDPRLKTLKQQDDISRQIYQGEIDKQKNFIDKIDEFKNKELDDKKVSLIQKIKNFLKPRTKDIKDINTEETDIESQPVKLNPISQITNKEKYGVECKKFAIANKIIELGALFKPGVTEEILMNRLKEAKYGNKEITEVLNGLLYDKNVKLTDIDDLAEIKKMIESGNTKNLVYKFRQSEYWGPSLPSDAFHFVGDAGPGDTSSDRATHDPWNLKIYTNRGQVDEIVKTIKVELVDKKNEN